MAVRDTLLVLLTAGPAYGFQLHGELTRRTGGRRVVNVGQTYATLDRLTARKLIESAGTTDDGLPLHGLTDAGRTEALAWLDGADAAGADPWDETVDRVLVAASLPGIDADDVVGAERRRWEERLAEASARATEAAADPAAALSRLAAHAEQERARAALAWIGAVAEATPEPFAPAAERPRRGRRPGSRAPAQEDAGTEGTTSPDGPADDQSTSA
ncbi:helix-turn-helix transcriptional regulator [Agromyces sp. G08B096]|uniref:Helix-turn-helix transcriptional regulator n=1 Tax=Agromyces sp. G08B096 TaxID=3156399 RepID=A0AAU7W4S1_9MICO